MQHPAFATPVSAAENNGFQLLRRNEALNGGPDPFASESEVPFERLTTISRKPRGQSIGGLGLSGWRGNERAVTACDHTHGGMNRGGGIRVRVSRGSHLNFGDTPASPRGSPPNVPGVAATECAQ